MPSAISLKEPLVKNNLMDKQTLNVVIVLVITLIVLAIVSYALVGRFGEILS